MNKDTLKMLISLEKEADAIGWCLDRSDNDDDKMRLQAEYDAVIAAINQIEEKNK